ncbi:hypothetical protein GUJ93_ZPchr0001g31890 [Zizania palustris]|uniref:Uncharacterized protein n=1 Tax=Zizania palustris TaxID=103762 RepID=A0A8J5S913_ZIZPA|nr:hypothetical protein GUJ93_ZPchr0001g31890 [Zizania palustris]
MQAGRIDASNAFLERSIYQTLRELLPGVSTSDNSVGGAIMRRAEALANCPEYQEFIEQDPRWKVYIKQDANVHAKREDYKRRELSMQTKSTCSAIQGSSPPFPSHDQRVIIKKTVPSTSKNTTITLLPWPVRKGALNKSFQVFSSMPVRVRE